MGSKGWCGRTSEKIVSGKPGTSMQKGVNVRRYTGMTFTNHDETLMSQDGRGRVLVPKERREALLDEFERSGLSGVKFARLAGIKYPTFASWASKRREARRASGMESGGVAQGSVGFVEAELDRAAPGVRVGGGGLAIELPGGARVQVQSPLQLQMAAELLRLLAVSPGVRSC